MTVRRDGLDTRHPGRFGRILGILAVSILGGFLYFTFLPPMLERIDPVAFGPDGIVTLHGRNFGTARGRNVVYIDDALATVSSYLAWTDTSISLRLPGSADSAIIRVKTAFGRSKPGIALNATLLPRPASNQTRVTFEPSITSIKPAEASVGSLLEIEGMNFGSAANVSKVLFSSNDPESNGSPFISAEGSAYYERWDDKKILVRVPEGAGSGVVIASTPQGDSEPFTFKVRPGSGVKRLYDPISYAVKTAVKIKVIAGSADSSLVLHLPDPPGSPSQTPAAPSEESHSFSRTQGGIASARLSAPQLGEIIVSTTSILTVRGVEAELAAYRESLPEGDIPTFLQSSLSEDILVPSRLKEISNLAAKITGKEKNLQRKALAIKNWLLKNVKWKPSQPDPRVGMASVISSGRADSRNYALLATALFRAAGVPALPVAGLLAGDQGKGIPHFWLEYYLPSVGWIPYDPVMATGARPDGFSGGLESSSEYFGSLDNKHLVMTRGLIGMRALVDGSERVQNKVFWSFQSFFEESKDLKYRSSWEDVLVEPVY